MPDLTGTPTTLGIGTFNVDADAPSGLGFNQAMGQIDALLQARVSKPAGIAIGEVPVWNGSAFVRPTSQPITVSALAPGTNGQVLTTSGGVAAWGAGSSVSIGTTLPASPNDGDEAILVDSTTAPTYAWRFRYDASVTDANKWIFIGGAPITVTSPATNYTQTPGTTYVNLTNRVNVTVPRAGLYVYKLTVDGIPAAGAQGWVAVKEGSTAASDARSTNPRLVSNSFSGTRYFRTGSLSASDVLEAQVRTSTGTVTIGAVDLDVVPVRVA